MPLQKVTLNLREGDWEFLAAHFSQKTTSPSFVIRKLVSTFVDRKRAEQAQELKLLPQENLDV